MLAQVMPRIRAVTGGADTEFFKASIIGEPMLTFF
jgi:hypothetical protein